MKYDIIILIFILLILYVILIYCKYKEPFNSVLDLPTGVYTDSGVCSNNCTGTPCSSNNLNGYCTATGTVCSSGVCKAPVCGGKSISSSGAYSENNSGFCKDGSSSCQNGRCIISKNCGNPDIINDRSLTGVCLNNNTCENGRCNLNLKHCSATDSSATGCNIPGYTCANGNCVSYIRTPNFSFGGYNPSNPPINGLTDLENRVFTGVDLYDRQNVTVEQCKTVCNQDPNCGAFTRPFDQDDNYTLGTCYFKKRFNDSKGNMLSNRYSATQYPFNSWIKAREYEKINIKRSTDGKIFPLL